jgi:hypothetical protein
MAGGHLRLWRNSSEIARLPGGHESGDENVVARNNNWAKSSARRHLELRWGQGFEN